MEQGGQVVFLRHGESLWNQQNRFTGWRDVGLSDTGRREAMRCGRQLKRKGMVFTRVYTSVLLRALQTVWLISEQLDQRWFDIRKAWCLNERHYGALQGLNKDEAVRQYGAEQVFKWRRHYNVALPQLEVGEATHPLQMPLYQMLSERDSKLKSYISGSMGESLADCVQRVWPFWQNCIEPDLKQGHTILVVAHGNSLRALVKMIEGIADDKIHELNIDTAKPFAYNAQLKAAGKI